MEFRLRVAWLVNVQTCLMFFTRGLFFVGRQLALLKVGPRAERNSICGLNCARHDWAGRRRV